MKRINTFCLLLINCRFLASKNDHEACKIPLGDQKWHIRSGILVYQKWQAHKKARENKNVQEKIKMFYLVILAKIYKNDKNILDTQSLIQNQYQNMNIQYTFNQESKCKEAQPSIFDTVACFNTIPKFYWNTACELCQGDAGNKACVSTLF